METEDGSRLRSEAEETKTEVRMGRYTAMCGDPNLWFPMRVTYAREMKVNTDGTDLTDENRRRF